MLVEARGLIDRFLAIIRMKVASDLETWIREASTNLIAPFASGITRGRVAVQAAITEP